MRTSFFRCGILGKLFAKVSPAWSWLLRHVPFKERWGLKVEGAKVHGKVGKLLRQTMSFYVIRFHDYAQIKSDEYDL